MAAKAQARKKEEPATPPAGLSLLGGVSNLSDLLQPVSGKQKGLPDDIEIKLIDEDSQQPRGEDNPGFSKQSLGELAEDIKKRGVKSPISLRVNPDIEGRYTINHGARRYRASIIAGKETIPAFIDNDFRDEDQVVENIQRENLTPREIANYIGRKLSEGMRKIDIAKSISKSPAFVTQHAALLDLPDAIATAFNSGRINDVTLINDLVTVNKKHPEEVQELLDDSTQEINRASVKLLREYCAEKTNEDQEDKAQGPETSNDDPAPIPDKPKKAQRKDPDPTKFKKAIVKVEFDGRSARLILTRRPTSEGCAWLKYDEDGQEIESSLKEVQIVAIIEG